MAKYLYNGVGLPALPEWDKEIYPYAKISEVQVTGGVQYIFSACESKHYVSSDKDSCHTKDGEPNGSIQCLIYTWDLTQWGEIKEYPGTSYPDDAILPFWTNFDLLNADGTLYLPASEPVPVTQYTATYDLKSFLMGVVDELAGKP